MIVFSKLPGALLRHGHPTTVFHDYYLSIFLRFPLIRIFFRPHQCTASWHSKLWRAAISYSSCTVHHDQIWASSGTALHAPPRSAAQTCDLSHIHRCTMCSVSPGKSSLEERLAPTLSTLHSSFRCCTRDPFGWVSGVADMHHQQLLGLQSRLHPPCRNCRPGL